MPGLGGQPVFIMSEDSTRTTGEEAQQNNIDACTTVSKAVRSTLGPKGMDKMMVDSMGDIVVTNDGVTILEEMDLEHPAAKMMVEVAQTQEEEVGDGTTSAVVLAGELPETGRGSPRPGDSPDRHLKGLQVRPRESHGRTRRRVRRA
jgi:thermosome subunit